jgi:hypothetical protein
VRRQKFSQLIVARAALQGCVEGFFLGPKMDGGYGAFSPIRRVISHRLQSADSRLSRPRPGTGRFEDIPPTALALRVRAVADLLRNF